MVFKKMQYLDCVKKCILYFKNILFFIILKINGCDKNRCAKKVFLYYFQFVFFFVKCHLPRLSDQKACFGAQSHVFDPWEVGDIFVLGRCQVIDINRTTTRKM